eukprot:ANDGO_05649.mRNA.1 hypothetical protein
MADDDDLIVTESSSSFSNRGHYLYAKGVSQLKKRAIAAEREKEMRDKEQAKELSFRPDTSLSRRPGARTPPLHHAYNYHSHSHSHPHPHPESREEDGLGKDDGGGYARERTSRSPREWYGHAQGQGQDSASGSTSPFLSYNEYLYDDADSYPFTHMYAESGRQELAGVGGTDEGRKTAVEKERPQSGIADKLNAWARKKEEKLEQKRAEFVAMEDQKIKAESNQFMSKRSRKIIELAASYKSVVKDWDDHFVHHIERKLKGEIDPSVTDSLFTPRINPQSAALVYDAPVSERLYRDALDRLSRKEAYAEISALESQAESRGGIHGSPSTGSLGNGTESTATHVYAFDTAPHVTGFSSFRSSPPLSARSEAISDRSLAAANQVVFDSLYRDAERQRLVRFQASEALDVQKVECTFSPRINPSSHYAKRKPLYESPRGKDVSKSEGKSRPGLASSANPRPTRLPESVNNTSNHNASSCNSGGGGGGSSSKKQSESDDFLIRLAEDGAHRQINRQIKLVEEQSRLHRECPFKPKLYASPPLTAVSSYNALSATVSPMSRSRISASSPPTRSPSYAVHTDREVGRREYQSRIGSSPPSGTPSALPYAGFRVDFQDSDFSADLASIESFLRHSGMLRNLDADAGADTDADATAGSERLWRFEDTMHQASDLASDPEDSRSTSRQQRSDGMSIVHSTYIDDDVASSAAHRQAQQEVADLLASISMNSPHGH